MLPVVTSQDHALRGGFAGYIKRRARRILPPYYAALAFAVLMGAFVIGQGAPAPGQLISHSLLFHNFTPEWLFGLNAPMWSIAIEWQIYFVFAAILLPVWRWGGIKSSLPVAFILGLAPLYLLPRGRNGEWSCPWYIGLFALGMCAAAIQWGGLRRWRAAAGGFALLTIGVFAAQQLPWARGHWSMLFRQESRGVSWPLDVMVGFTVACALVSLARTEQCAKERPNRWAIRTLQSKPVAALGLFSYSLYLIHNPVLGVLAVALAKMSLPATVSYLATYAIGIPVGLVAGYLLYIAVERHCVSARPTTASHARSRDELHAPTIAVVSPASA